MAQEKKEVVNSNKDLSKSNNKSKVLKNVFKGIFFGAVTILAIVYILKDDPVKTFQAMSQASVGPILLAIAVLFFSFIVDGAALTLLTRIYSPRYRFTQGVINVMVGQTIGVFAKVSAPLLQVHTFSKQDVAAPQAASILTMNLLMYQFSLIVYSLVISIIGFHEMKTVPLTLIGDMPIVVFSIVGLVGQLAWLILMVLVGFCRPLHRFVLNTGVNILGKLHIWKNPEEKRKQLSLQFATYRVEMKRLGKNITVTLFTFILNLLKQFLLGLIPFIIFCSLAPKEGNNIFFNADFFFKALVGTGYTNCIGSLFTVGVPEIFYQETFKHFLLPFSNVIQSPINTAAASNLLWRTITFYVPFIVGVFSMVIYKGKPKKYVLLSDTATIYDLGAASLVDDNADSDTKSYLDEVKQGGKKKNASLLDRLSIQRTFKRLSSALKESEQIEDDSPIKDNIEDDITEELLSKSIDDLALVAKDVELLMSAKPSIDEIEQEIEKDNALHNQKMVNRRKRKEQRKAKKRLKQMKKEENELMKFQPLGSKLVYDVDKGLFINKPAIEEIKIEPTHSPDEK